MAKQNDNITAHSSSEYDNQILRTIPYYDKFHEETIHLMKAYVAQPKIWLDTGCGTGVLVHKCLEVFHETQFILSDPSESMLEVAQQSLSEYTGRVNFLEPATTQDIPSYLTIKPDVITAIQAHHYLSVSDRIKATKVCFDLLNVGGIYITFENICPMTKAGINIGKQNWGEYQLSKGKTKEKVENHLARFGKEYFPITIEEHLDLYRRCGFKVVEMLWYSYMQAGFFCIK
jgi:tRNA (cmo5U34)-methyltransferase